MSIRLPFILGLLLETYAAYRAVKFYRARPWG